MAGMKHNRTRAKKFLQLIDQTKNRADLEFCFAVGTVGDLRKPAVLVSKKKLNGLAQTLKNMPFEDDEDSSKENFSLLRRGTGRMNENGVILVKLADGGKAGFPQVQKVMKKYFVNFRMRLPDMQEAGILTEEDIQQFEMNAEENSQFLPPDDSEEFNRPMTALDSAEGNSAGSVEETEERSKREGGAELLEQLLPEVKEGIAAAAATISNHAVSLSAQIGAGQTAELSHLTTKIADWLQRVLAATPPEEQEATLHNFAGRLLLMLAYPENLRNLQYVDDMPDGAGQGETNGDRREEVVVNGIDLNRVPTGALDQDEVVESLFRLIKAKAQERQLSYPLENANSERIAKIVSSQWPKELGDAARRRAVVERLIAAVVPRLGNDDQLLVLLGIADQPERTKSIENSVESIIAIWQAHLDTALTLRDEVKSKINRMVDVEARGGTWRYVDDIFLQFGGELSDQLSAITERNGEALSSATERVRTTVQKKLDYLNGSDIVAMLDNPPIDIGPGTIGQTLREGLAAITDGLKRIETSRAAPAA
ncbi:hypothetical protein [Rhizobium esperanzae]|uniref:hypothetical protein n=1 Tax=Rhizobium esperanzae TaxID=1967781 RepID=UPI00161BB610|nr:hypothetical protein [Rhizobium esperanzae]MBB4436572.1 hypothetical protein [Rhizobium esperanzae]